MDEAPAAGQLDMVQQQLDRAATGGSEAVLDLLCLLSDMDMDGRRCAAQPVEPGDDLAAIIAGAIRTAGLTIGDRDVLVVAQKIVSKAEGRYVELADVTPSAHAHELAAIVNKDPRFVEIVLSESAEVVP